MSRRLSLLALLAGALLVPTSQASAAEAPQVEATWVEEVTATSARLRAEIDPGGAPSTYRFEYLTLAAYEANVKAAKDPFAGAAKAPLSGSGAVKAGESVTQHIAKLTPATLYRFRVSATNEVTTTPGPVRPFATQAPTNAFALLDSRGWEMVSPVDKNGGAIQAPEAIFGGGVFQAAADGQSLTYSSADSFGAGAQGAPAGSQYVATRSGSGWQTQNITTALSSGGYGDRPNGVPYQLFSGDLARALMLDPRRCPETCPRSYSLRQRPSGPFSQSPQASGLRFEGASADLGHSVFGSTTGLYEWGGTGPFTQLSANAETTLAAPSGAISEDGNRVYFTQEGKLFLREGIQTKQIDEAQGGGGAFQVASTDDGRYAFFTKAAHLYRWDANSEVATDLTPAGEVKGVLGASADGSHVYYLSTSGLFLWNAGVGTQVAKAAAASDYPPSTGTARVSADGTHLLFLSQAELTGYENNGQMEVFLYGPAPSGGGAKLTCVSCNPTGERPQGASSIPGAISNGGAEGAFAGYKPRALSVNGNRVFFESSDDLAIQDSNARQDVYEWEAQGVGSCAFEGGCVQLISSGRSAAPSSFIDASADGSDAFFLTEESLAFGDPGSFDLYDARVGGGFPAPENFIACEGDACQALPEAPEDPTPGTLVANGGNPAQHFVTVKDQKSAKKGKGKKKHHHKKGHKQGGKK